MRIVNYKTNGQIQEMKAYTMDEVLTGLKIRSNDSYGQPLYIETAMANMNLTISSRDKPVKFSRREKLYKLVKTVTKLESMLHYDEYLAVEVMNIAINLQNPDILPEIIELQRKLWDNVVK